VKRVLLALALALAACAAPAQEQTAAAALAPLLGCWRGTFENNQDITDERCFQVLGEHVVDTHFVRPTTYSGETTYHFDGAAGVIVFAYAASDGGRSNGSLRVDGDRILLAPHTHVGGAGTEHRLRATWTLEGGERLVMAAEREEGGVWRPFMHVTYTRAPELSPPP
jgi:hypothetical protein